MFPLLVLLVGCKSAADVTLRLPEAGTLVVEQQVDTLTRTPHGPEELTVTSTRRLAIHQGGRRGTADLEWYEETLAYQVDFVTAQGELHWTGGGLDPIPEQLAELAPVWRRNVFVAPDGTVYVQRLRDPPPPPDPEEERKKKRRKPPVVVEPPPEPLPDELEEPRPAADAEVDPWLLGLARAPLVPTAAGTPWSWTDSQAVTQGTTVSTTVSWQLDRVQGGETIFGESVTMTGGGAPATADAFQITGLWGSGELRFDTTTGAPRQYTSKVEADLATAFARGTSVRKTTTKFKLEPPLPEAPPEAPEAPVPPEGE